MFKHIMTARRRGHRDHTARRSRALAGPSRAAALVAAAGLAAGLTACSSGGSAGSGGSGGSGSGPFTITLGSVTPTANTINVFVADQEGFLAKNGLALNFRMLSNSLTVMSGLGKSYDMSFGFPPQEIIGRQQGLDVTVVASLAYDDPTHPGSGLVVPAGSSISNLSGLTGKTVGCVGLTDDLYEGFLYELDKAHVDTSGVKGIAVPSAAQQAQLTAHKISAAVGTYPFITEMKKAGMKDLGDPLQSVGQKVAETNLVTTTQFAATHKTQMAHLRTALDEANAWIKAHPSQVVPILVKWSGQSEAAVKAAPLPGYDTAFTETEFNQWMTVLKTVVPNFHSSATYAQVSAGFH
jgi:NitT/TauT family transport system substrate-binding protein